MMPEWFQKGGITMWPLLVCSVVGLAIVLERIWALQRKRIISRDLAESIEKNPGATDLLARIQELSRADESVLGELARITFGHAALAKVENVEAVQAAARQIVGRLERGLTTLSLIVEISPFLGLLGTVLGMVRLFTDVAERGLGEPKLISQGIFEALITTVTGLAIAIPALIAYMYLRRRIEVLALEMERHINELLTKLYRD
jgi:biopolymer transport protein ExbB